MARVASNAVSVTAVAERLGIARQVLAAWRAKGYLPMTSPGVGAREIHAVEINVFKYLDAKLGPRMASSCWMMQLHLDLQLLWGEAVGPTAEPRRPRAPRRLEVATLDRLALAARDLDERRRRWWQLRPAEIKRL